MNGTKLAKLVESLGREMSRLGLKAVNVRYKDSGTLQTEVVPAQPRGGRAKLSKEVKRG